MITQLSNPKAWVNTLLLAGLGVLANGSVGLAQDRKSLVNADAVMVSVNDDAEKISQVGFFDESWGGESSCDMGCDACGMSTSNCCCTPWWAHRTGGFGEFLLLRPGNVDQIYAIEQNTIVPGVDPTGPVGRVNVDEEAGFRVGAVWAATCYTSLVASYSNFEGNTSNTIVASAGDVLNSQIIHPNALTVGSGSLQSSAAYSIDFELIDLAYRHIWKTSNVYAINWLAGFRYGELEQDFASLQEVSVATGLVLNDVDVDFSGFGMMFGVDGERRSCHTGLRLYGKALASFLAGDWTGSYIQVDQFFPGSGVIANSYEDYRVTPVMELELGLGWQSKCGHFRGNVGYLTSAWYDAISTREYIDAVRNTNYVSIDETITFSGLTAGVEARF